jgi:hypothetical protein
MGREPCSTLMDTLDPLERARLYLEWHSRGVLVASAAADPVAALHRLRLADLDRRAGELNLVRAARERGDSWERIADALGVKRQSAWERFAHLIESDR